MFQKDHLITSLPNPIHSDEKSIILKTSKNEPTANFPLIWTFSLGAWRQGLIFYKNGENFMRVDVKNFSRKRSSNILSIHILIIYCLFTWNLYNYINLISALDHYYRIFLNFQGFSDTKFLQMYVLIKKSVFKAHIRSWNFILVLLTEVGGSVRILSCFCKREDGLWIIVIMVNIIWFCHDSMSKFGSIVW